MIDYKSLIQWTHDYYLNNEQDNYDIHNHLCYFVNPKKHKVKDTHQLRHDKGSKFLKNKHPVYELKDIPHDADVYLYRTFNSHGMEGGNCWGDEARGYNNPYPRTFNFDKFTLKLCQEFYPDISFIKYKLLVEECITEEEYEEYEYYGNHSVYQLIAFNLRKFVEGVEKS